MKKALEKIKEIIDFCDAVGCHRAIYESIKFVEKELEEAMKPKSCDDCMFDYCGCSVQDSILRADNTATFETFCCNRFKQKDNA